MAVQKSDGAAISRASSFCKYWTARPLTQSSTAHTHVSIPVRYIVRKFGIAYNITRVSHATFDGPAYDVVVCYSGRCVVRELSTTREVKDINYHVTRDDYENWLVRKTPIEEPKGLSSLALADFADLLVDLIAYQGFEVGPFVWEMEALDFWKVVLIKQEDIDEMGSGIRLDEVKTVKGKSDEIAETEADTAEDGVDHKMDLGKYRGDAKVVWCIQ